MGSRPGFCRAQTSSKRRRGSVPAKRRALRIAILPLLLTTSAPALYWGGTFMSISVGEPPVTSFTALGDIVNTTARLASAAGPGEILVMESTASASGLVDPERIGVWGTSYSGAHVLVVLDTTWTDPADAVAGPGSGSSKWGRRTGRGRRHLLEAQRPDAADRHDQSRLLPGRVRRRADRSQSAIRALLSREAPVLPRRDRALLDAGPGRLHEEHHLPALGRAGDKALIVLGHDTDMKDIAAMLGIN